MWKVRSFGRDCMGNITGYVVERYVWVPREYSQRSDGLSQEREECGVFVGNIYQTGSFEQARNAADLRCAELND